VGVTTLCRKTPCFPSARGFSVFVRAGAKPIINLLKLDRAEAIVPFGTSGVAASMVLSMIERREYLDKWRQSQKMKKSRWDF